MRVAVWVAQGVLIFLAGVMLAQGTTALFGPHHQAQEQRTWDCGDHPCGPVAPCQGTTVAAPFAVVTGTDGSTIEWFTCKGD
jgi:hypothetical protein